MSDGCLKLVKCRNIIESINKNCLNCTEKFASLVLDWDPYFSHIGGNILHLSVGKPDILKFLLENLKIKEYINFKDIHGATPLNSLYNHFNFDNCLSFKILIENGALIDTKDSQGGTPLNGAAMFNCLYCVKNMLDSVSNSVSNSLEPIFNSVSNSLETIVNHKDIRGCFPLFYAIENGNKEMIELLISSGAKSQEIEQGKNLLFYCIDFRKKIEIIQILIDRSDTLSIDLNEEYKNGENILHLISYYKDEYIFDLLPPQVVYININKKDDKGRTPLFFAIKPRLSTLPSISFIKNFLEMGALINVKDKKGRLVIDYINKYLKIDLEYNLRHNDVYSQILKLITEWQELPPF